MSTTTATVQPASRLRARFLQLLELPVAPYHQRAGSSSLPGPTFDPDTLTLTLEARANEHTRKYSFRDSSMLESFNRRESANRDETTKFLSSKRNFPISLTIFVYLFKVRKEVDLVETFFFYYLIVNGVSLLTMFVDNYQN